MKTLVIIIVCVTLSSCNCFASGWDKTEIGLEAAFATLSIIDWGQTLKMSDNSWGTKKYTLQHTEIRRHESNLILGRHPSRGTINIYFPAYIVSQALAAHYLPDVVMFFGGSEAAGKITKKVFQSLYIGVELEPVISNIGCQGGFKLHF